MTKSIPAEQITGAVAFLQKQRWNKKVVIFGITIKTFPNGRYNLKKGDIEVSCGWMEIEAELKRLGEME